MNFLENSNRPGLAAVAAVLVIYALAASAAAR